LVIQAKEIKQFDVFWRISIKKISFKK
jgi:hypothetical protein